MANLNCCLCFNECVNENGISIFDDKLDVDIPKLVAKYLLIIIENNEDEWNASTKFSTKICRMCFVHLLDFHYFFLLVEQKQQEHKLSPAKFETVTIWDSETDEDGQSTLDFLDSISEISDGHFRIMNEADGSGTNGRTNYITNDENIELETEADGIVKKKVLEDKVTLDPVLFANKFTYDDDTGSENAVNIVETSSHQNKNDIIRTRKRKKTRQNDVCQNSSIKETIIKLRRRTENIYDIVDENGHLKRTAKNYNTQRNEKLPTALGIRSGQSNNKACLREAKKSRIRRTRSDELTYKIIASNGQLECDICFVKLKRFRDLVQHFYKKHVDLRPYVVCCNKRHYSPKVFANHILSHSNPELFKCEICDKVLGTQYSYRMHNRIKHSGKRKVYKCNICGKRLLSARYFEVHVLNHT